MRTARQRHPLDELLIADIGDVHCQAGFLAKAERAASPGIGVGKNGREFRSAIRDFRSTTPAMNDPMLPLPDLSPVCGKKVVARSDGGELSWTAALWFYARSSNGSVLLIA